MRKRDANHHRRQPDVLPAHTLGLLVVLVLSVSGCATGPSTLQDSDAKTRDPAAAAVLVEAGRSAWAQGNADLAITQWQQALALNPDDATTANNLAVALKDEHHYRQAAETLRQAIQREPDVANLHYNLGVISELYLLDLPEALAQYRAYQQLTGGSDSEVDGWIADLERRVNP